MAVTTPTDPLAEVAEAYSPDRPMPLSAYTAITATHLGVAGGTLVLAPRHPDA